MIKLVLPEEIYPILFADAALSLVINDGKLLSDATSKFTAEYINTQYLAQKEVSDFDMISFLNSHFEIPNESLNTFVTDSQMSISQHIDRLWGHLGRLPDAMVEDSSLIPLPYDYVVPGGRFNEIYYWDSYFTMLGLKVSGRVDTIESMLNNFDYLIKEIGFIPNGNRTYFLSRSQPPFYSLMVALLAEIKGDIVLPRYLESLQLEYDFWMSGKDDLTPMDNRKKHVVLLHEGTVLNRYFDALDTPRTEMYADDVHLSADTNRDQHELFSNLRAACESGWDFSSRWCDDPKDLSSIHTTDIVPVDLNCLMYHLEIMLGRAYRHVNEIGRANNYAALAESRKKAINHYFWDDRSGYYFDFDIRYNRLRDSICLAGIFPLSFAVCDKKQAERSLSYMEKHLLFEGGLSTTNIESGQQWDAPNGWAPLQWMAILGALQFDGKEIAETVMNRWCGTVEKTFSETGKMMEKYNVQDSNLTSGGGEYPVQDGFGWTNGVYLAIEDLRPHLAVK